MPSPPPSDPASSPIGGPEPAIAAGSGVGIGSRSGPDEELRQQRRNLFTTAGDRYRHDRPGYPPEVFELLASRCGLGPGVDVLEIGPGGGQATEPLLDAGASVVAVELGSELAESLRSRLAHRPLEVTIGAFEEVALPERRFDLAVSATAFHWVPTAAGLARCAEAVRPGGWLALWWNVWGDPDRPDPYHHALQPVLERHAPHLTSPNPDGPGAPLYALDVAARTAEIDADGRFGPVEHHRLRWTGRHDGAGLRALFATFSPWLALEPSVREPLLDEMAALVDRQFGGTVERPYLTSIYLSRRQA